MGLGLSSPPIRKGDRAAKIWRYNRRIDRLQAMAQRTPRLTLVKSSEIGGCVLDTMEHLEALGIEFDEYGNATDTEKQ